jgi:outer membrane beta-barrel protein
MMKLNTTFALLLTLTAPMISWAQSGDNEELNVIEMEIDREAPKASAPVNSTENYNEQKASDNTLSDFSGLTGLSPFEEVSVIQKRYMPKTGRFQLFGGLTTVTNDPFFMTYGAAVKAGYFLTEKWGVELNYFALSTSTRSVTQDLKDQQNVRTENLVYPKSFMGLDLMYVPIYGKMTWFNETIVPFDLYFSAGYGTTTTQTDESPGTLHLATGQIFSISKSYAFRWDFSWNFFNAKGIDGDTAYNNLFLTVGMSWFFPEASYR